MVKLFSAYSLKELENKVNNFEKEYGGVFYFSEHSVSYSEGLFIMSVILANKDYN